MLASADRQMRVLTPIILPQALLMNRVQTKVLFRSTIRTEFVGHDRRRPKALPLQELAHQTFCRPGIPAALDQEIQDFALAVDSPPEIEPPPSHHDHHLVEISAICWSMTPMPDAASIDLTKLEELAAHGFMGNIQSTFGQKLLDITKTESLTQKPVASALVA
jgi:hypothetical protein